MTLVIANNEQIKKKEELFLFYFTVSLFISIFVDEAYISHGSSLVKIILFHPFSITISFTFLHFTVH